MDRTLTRKGILFILIGPTGSGKTTLCSRLIEEFPSEIKYSISVTSRTPRAQEVQGKSYQFISRAEFEARRTQGEFFEWEEIHGNLYGTLKANLVNGIDSGRDLLFQIDVRGALNFKRAFPDNTVTIFLVPPSFAVLRYRIEGRGPIDPEELKRRFKTAREEYSALLRLAGNTNSIDYLIVNHDIERAYDQVRSVVMAERARYHRMDVASVERFCEIDALGSEE